MTTLRSNLTATAGALALVGTFLFASAPANALGLKDCSDKFTAAKAAGKAGNKTFADFQKSDCGPDAKPVAAPAATTTPAVKPADTKAVTKPADATPAATKPAETKPAAATVPAVDAKAAAKAARAEKRKADKAAKDATAKSAVALPVKEAVFPSKIADEFKTKKPHKARFASCLAQYKANKATNANGGMKWIQKGGGYYSQCNKKLKG